MFFFFSQLFTLSSGLEVCDGEVQGGVGFISCDRMLIKFSEAGLEDVMINRGVG